MRKNVQYEVMQLVTQMRAILDRAEKEKRDLNSDEQMRYGLLEEQYDRLAGWDNHSDDYISEQRRKDELVEGGFEAALERWGHIKGEKVLERRDIPTHADTFRFWKNPSEQSQRHAFNRYLVHGAAGITDVEFRALQAESDVAGGFLVMPMALQNDVIMKLRDLVWMRKFAKIYTQPNAESIGIAYLHADPGTYDISWTAELATGSEDSDMAFRRRDLSPHPLARRIKVSNKLLRASTLNPEGIIRDRMTYVFSIAEEYNFLQGNGVNGPLGVLVASDWGITSSQDTTSGTSGAIDPDDIYDVIYSIKAQYRVNGRWIVGRDAIKAIRLLKDGEGRWMWEPSVQAGQPARLAGYPIHESEYFPSYSSGAYAAIFGDFSNYVICDALTMEIKRLDELYAETNQTGYIARKETDGCPVLSEAFARLKLA